MPANPFYYHIFLDSCAFDPKDDRESSAAKEIFEYYEKGDINLLIAPSIMREVKHPNTPTHVKAEAMSKIYTIKTNLNLTEARKKQEIWDILTGNGNPAKMKKDAEHVFEVHKYGGYFATTDNRILKRAKELHNICDAHIVKPSELLKIIYDHEDS